MARASYWITYKSMKLFLPLADYLRLLLIDWREWHHLQQHMDIFLNAYTRLEHGHDTA